MEREEVLNLLILTNPSQNRDYSRIFYLIEPFPKTLQEYNKAKVVGVKSYGKGTVVSSYTLSNGGNVTISTGLYRTSTGDCIEEIGVNPDYKVELTEEKLKYFYELTIEEDDQLQKGIEVLNSF